MSSLPFLTSIFAACDSHAHNLLPALSHAPISYFDQDEKEINANAKRFREGGADSLAGDGINHVIEDRCTA